MKVLTLSDLELAYKKWEREDEQTGQSPASLDVDWQQTNEDLDCGAA